MAQTWQKFQQNLTGVIVSGAGDGIDNVALNTSGDRELIDVGAKAGNLLSLAIHTGNTILFDFRLFRGAIGVAGSVIEIYRAIDITQFWQKEGLQIYYVNSDAPQTTNLYLELDNRSTTIATGVITLQLFIRAPGTGAV